MDLDFRSFESIFLVALAQIHRIIKIQQAIFIWQMVKFWLGYFLPDINIFYTAAFLHIRI